MKIKTIEISNEDITDVLTTALEGGSNYWYNLPDLSMIGKDAGEYMTESMTDKIINSALHGVSIPIYDIEAQTSDDDAVLGELSLANIERGLNLFIDDGREFDPAMDADEADVLFQFIVMGEIVFG